MKKQLSILLSSFFIFQSCYVLAEPLTEDTISGQSISNNTGIMRDAVQITLSLKDGYCHSADAQAVLDISDGETTYTKIVNIGNSMPSQSVTFYVNPYKEKTFYITPVSGVDKLFLNGIAYDLQNPLIITPEALNAGEINVQYIPSFHNAVDIAVNGLHQYFSAAPRNIGEHVIVPIDEMAAALSLTYTYQNGIHTVFSPAASLSIDADNNAYVEKQTSSKTKQNLPVAPQVISGKLFVPISLFASAFNLTLTMEQQAEKPILYIATGPIETFSQKNDYVNTKGLSSQTDYLVWISKSEYKVRVYMGLKGNWNLIKTFTCGIGAPGTPTCEGTYKYYQAQAKWDYGTYYVGPVMRFNGGYAIHSTLLYPNGTPKDNRVGIKLSHGCIRLRPDDINWMFYYVPLYTTIHITG